MDFNANNLDKYFDYRDSHAVSFATCFGENWKDHFTTKEAISELFRQIKISTGEVIDIHPVPNDSPDRITVLVTTKQSETRAITKTIIDFTTGGPTWEQFIDLTYDLGANTDLKIIVYDDVWIKPEPAGSGPELADLVAINNQCGVRTILVETICSMKDGVKRLEYFLYQDLYSERNHYLHSDSEEFVIPWTQPLPTKRQIQEAAFWAGYYGGTCQFQGAPPIKINARVINGWTPGFEVTPGVEIRALWTEEGFSMNLLAKPESEKLSQIWNEGKAIFMEEYSEHDVVYSPNSNGKAVISVKLDKTPISDLIDLRFEDKWEYAELVYYQEGKFQEIVEEIIRITDEKDRKH